MTTVLIADTDVRTRDVLPGILSDRLPDLAIDVSASVDDLLHNRRLPTYDTIAISPILFQDYQNLKHKAKGHLFAPLILTAGREERGLASMFLQRDAFDIIVKPIVPEQAAQAVRVALWQNKLLKLLASKEQATIRFQEHMQLFPNARQMEQEFASKMVAYEKSIRAITTSLEHLLNKEQESSLFDLAGFVEIVTKQRALERLSCLDENRSTEAS